MIRCCRPIFAVMLLILSRVAFAESAEQSVQNGQPLARPKGVTLDLPAATAHGASLNLLRGTAPEKPVNGDIWATSRGLFAQVDGKTVGPLATLADPVTRIGTGIGPFVWQPHTTTMGTIAGSATVSIAPGDAQYFRDGDHITSHACSGSSIVLSGGGTTSLDLDAPCQVTATNSPVTVGVLRYDTTSSSIVNSLGVGNTLLIGAAADGYGDWSGIYDGPGKYASISPLKVISKHGTRSATFASRLSDTPTTSGLKSMENVVELAVLDSKPAGINGGGWNVYSQSNLYAGAAPTVTGLGFISHEDSIYNQWTSPSLDPFQTNVKGYTENFRPDCGIGSGAASDCSAAIHIINNGAPYKSGIIFAANALNTSGDRTSAPAIAMGPWHELAWYRAAGKVAWGIFSDATTGDHYIRLTDNDGNGDVHITESSLSLGGAAMSPNRNINYKTGTVLRWQAGLTSTAEKGQGSGSDYAISRFGDAGTPLGTAIVINRATGYVGINRGNASYALDVNGVASAGQLRLAPTEFADLPACGDGKGVGVIAYITDASEPIQAWHQSVTAGGGANAAFISCSGAGWHAFDY